MSPCRTWWISCRTSSWERHLRRMPQRAKIGLPGVYPFLSVKVWRNTVNTRIELRGLQSGSATAPPHACASNNRNRQRGSSKGFRAGVPLQPPNACQSPAIDRHSGYGEMRRRSSASEGRCTSIRAPHLPIVSHSQFIECGCRGVQTPGGAVAEPLCKPSEFQDREEAKDVGVEKMGRLQERGTHRKACVRMV